MTVSHFLLYFHELFVSFWQRFFSAKEIVVQGVGKLGIFNILNLGHTFVKY